MKKCKFQTKLDYKNLDAKTKLKELNFIDEYLSLTKCMMQCRADGVKNQQMEAYT